MAPVLDWSSVMRFLSTLFEYLLISGWFQLSETAVLWPSGSILPNHDCQKNIQVRPQQQLLLTVG